VRRVLSTAFCVALLAAAAAAFALTEGAKTELSPIYLTHVDKIFSPVCDRAIGPDCIYVAHVYFVLRHPERLEVWMLHDGKRIETLVNGKNYPKGPVSIVFTGRNATGAVFPDGPYFPVVRLVGDHRTFNLPNEILLDTHAPRVVAHSRVRVHAVIAPGSLGAPQSVSVGYTFSADGHGVLFANGHRVALSYYQHPHSSLSWAGKIDGRLAPAGTYSLAIAAQDAAGNRSVPRAAGEVVVRYLTLSKRAIQVRPLKRFTVRVVIGPRRLTVVFAGRHLATSVRTLDLRAPKRRGHYIVYVSGAGHSSHVVVDVT
jgi:hypothetical protein